MDEQLEDKLGAILNNPQMMQQIMNLAQSLNQSAPSSPPDPAPQQVPQMDTNMLSRLGNLAKNSSINQNEQSLLRALTPYLSRNKLSKLERAMHAAKLAQAASGFLGNGGLNFLSGR